MFAGFEYYPLYLGVMLLLILGKTLFKGPDGLIVGSDRLSFLKGLFLCIFFIFFFGFRPSGQYFPDTHVFKTTYENVLYYGIDHQGRGDILYDMLINACAALRLNVETYFCIVAAFYMLPILLGARILFPGREYLALLFFCISFAFYSGGGTIIRNGVACSFEFLGIALWYRSNSNIKNRILSIIVLLAGCYLHNSAFILALSFVLSLLFIRNVKWSLIIWIGAILLALIIGRELGFLISEYIDDDRLQSYAEAGMDLSNFEGFSYSGFRWDFLSYSILGIIMIWYVRFKKHIINSYFNLLSNTYIISNAIWILFIYSSFSDRFARLSWSLLPFIFFFPLVKFNIWRKPNTATAAILFGQWIFLLVMGIGSLIFFFSFI